MSSSIRYVGAGGGSWIEETSLMPREKPDGDLEVVLRDEAEALWRAYQTAKHLLTTPESTFTFRYDYPDSNPKIPAGRHAEMACKASPQAAYQDYKYANGYSASAIDDLYVPLQGAEYFVAQEFHCTSRVIDAGLDGIRGFNASTAVEVFTIGRVSEQSDVPVTLDRDSFVSVIRNTER